MHWPWGQKVKRQILTRSLGLGFEGLRWRWAGMRSNASVHVDTTAYFCIFTNPEQNKSSQKCNRLFLNANEWMKFARPDDVNDNSISLQRLKAPRNFPKLLSILVSVFPSVVCPMPLAQNELFFVIFTGPPTHSIRGQTSNGVCRRLSSVTLHGGPAGGGPAGDFTPAGQAMTSCCLQSKYSSMVTLHGGPVVLRPVRATPCSVFGSSH